MKIIETSTKILETTLIPIETQSRVIEIENWQDYIDEVTNKRQVNRESIEGNNLVGVSFPKFAKLKSFYADERSLMCTLYLWSGNQSLNNNFILKTAYIIGE